MASYYQAPCVQRLVHSVCPRCILRGDCTPMTAWAVGKFDPDSWHPDGHEIHCTLFDSGVVLPTPPAPPPELPKQITPPREPPERYDHCRWCKKMYTRCNRVEVFIQGKRRVARLCQECMTLHKKGLLRWDRRDPAPGVRPGERLMLPDSSYLGPGLLTTPRSRGIQRSINFFAFGGPLP